MKLLKVLDKQIVGIISEAIQFDQTLREKITNKLNEIYNGRNGNTIPSGTQWGTVQDVYPELSEFCQTKPGVIGPEKYAHPGEEQYNWSIVNRFDTNSLVHNEIKRIYQTTNKEKDLYTWFDENARDFLTPDGKYTDGLVALNKSTFEKGLNRENKAEEIVKSNFPNIKISRFCSGSKSDFSHGKDLVVILPNNKTFAIQVKPFEPSKTFKYVDYAGSTYYKVAAQYYTSKNYNPKHVQIIMFVDNDNYILFTNDPKKIAQEGKTYTKFYEEPLKTNMDFTKVKKETSSKHIKDVRDLFSNPPNPQ